MSEIHFQAAAQTGPAPKSLFVSYWLKNCDSSKDAGFQNVHTICVLYVKDLLWLEEASYFEKVQI